MNSFTFLIKKKKTAAAAEICQSRGHISITAGSLSFLCACLCPLDEYVNKYIFPPPGAVASRDTEPFNLAV